MNYYMARDGTTYGPYPQESFPTMLAAGQVVPEDLVCPEGGTEWVPMSSVPGLSGAASPAPARPAAAAPAIAAASTAPRLKMSTPTSAPATPSYSSSASTGTAFPKQTFPQQKTSTMGKVAGAWGLLRIAGYGVAALVVVGVLIAGYVATQRDKKEIAKLHSLPGWSAFDAANNKINSESDNEGYGNTGEAGRVAKELAAGLELVQRENFKIESRPRYRGRSKLGRIASAASSATAGKGHFQTYVELRGDRALVLIHVPEFSRYKGDVKESMLELCWAAATVAVAEVSIVETPKPAAPAPRAATRPPGGRTPTAPAAAAASTPPPEPKLKDLTLVVGVRGKSAYEAVYVSKLNSDDDADSPTPIRKNVPSHKALVNWFGADKPDSATAGP